MASYTKGFLRVSLLTIPVKMNTANRSDGAPTLNQLHECCGSRIKCPKHCPTCNRHVEQSELVSAFEHSKGEYVMVNPAEFKVTGDKTIALESFVSESAVNPVFLKGDTHYLTPDGSVGERSLALLYQAMFDAKLCALGSVVLLGRKRYIALRALPGGVIAMMTLHYAGAVRRPSQFENTAVGASDAEYSLMRQLVEGLRGSFDFERCQDDYAARLHAYVAAKLAGETPPVVEEVEPIVPVDLMAQLKASLAAVA